MKRFFYWFCGIIALFALMVVIGTAMETEASICADTGSVWDEYEQRCRNDCLTWTEVHGCIYIDEAYQRLFVACANKTADCDAEELRRLNIQLCEKYQVARNLEYGYCDF